MATAIFNGSGSRAPIAQADGMPNRSMPELESILLSADALPGGGAA